MDVPIVDSAEAGKFIVLATRKSIDSPVTLTPKLIEILKIAERSKSDEHVAVITFLSNPEKHKTFDLSWVRVSEDNPTHHLVMLRTWINTILSVLKKVTLLENPLGTFTTHTRAYAILPSKKQSLKELGLSHNDPRVELLEEQRTFGDITRDQYTRAICALGSQPQEIT